MFDYKFNIVGIGASAGGLSAFEAFFSTVQKHDSINMAFVIVQHQALNFKSMLIDIIRRYTSLKVLEIVDEILVEESCIYLAPPSYNVILQNGYLSLTKMNDNNEPKLSIDYFFRSLAFELKKKSIGIILSGTGKDGSLGLDYIKKAGGLTIVQKPELASYDGMPLSAIHHVEVDAVLAAENMIDFITNKLNNSNIINSEINHIENEIEIHKIDYSNLEMIFHIVYDIKEHDFSSYKKNTMVRRINRRMDLIKAKDLDEYIKILQIQPNEVENLFNDLLIGVTSFFRDTDVYKKLEENIIPLLFKSREKSEPIRIWCVACSTGEEVFSIAILIYEYLVKINFKYTIQIFATDINPKSIEFARAGIYSKKVVEKLSKEQIENYFTIEENNKFYKVNKKIRDMIIFSQQSVIKDPPFSRIDFISCRNFLIYLDNSFQSKIIALFHYALKKDGILLLGSSESIGNQLNLFNLIERKEKIYQKITLDNVNVNLLNHFFIGHTNKDLLNLQGFKNKDKLLDKHKYLNHPNLKLKENRKSEGIDDMSLLEELQSVNEELQSTNEELETSKEELQSINEELTTVNAELIDKVNELSRTNNDITNLLSGTNIATIFLDSKLNIMRFTKMATTIFNLIPSDIGRPLEHLTNNLVGFLDLKAEIIKVQDSLEIREIEVKTNTNEWYNLIIQLYRTVENVIEGVVLTFVNITESVVIKNQLERSEELYRSLFSFALEGFIISDGSTGFITDVNPYVLNLYKKDKEDLKSNPIWEMKLFEHFLNSQIEFESLIEEENEFKIDDMIKLDTSKKIKVSIVSHTITINQKKMLLCNIQKI